MLPNYKIVRPLTPKPLPPQLASVSPLPISGKRRNVSINLLCSTSSNSAQTVKDVMMRRLGLMKINGSSVMKSSWQNSTEPVLSIRMKSVRNC